MTGSGSPLFFDMTLFDERQMKRISCKAGEFVFREGDRAKAVYVVEKGLVRLVRFTADGNRAVLHTAGRGASFAEAALFAERYHCSAEAAEPTVVTAVSRKHILDTLRTDNAKMEAYVALLSQQVRELRTRLELRSIRSARERILQYLYLRPGGAGGFIHLPAPLKDVAADLGLTHETFYRQLSALEKEGVIMRDGRRIRIRG